MSETYNFLNQSIRQIRKSIKDIDDSYNNDWDILAELVQNSVDAIRLSGRKDGEIKILVDCQNKSIQVSDNGVGIAPEKMQEVLAPFSTDKEDQDESVGEKGVGLTFVLFSCNNFYIKSGSKEGSSIGNVSDAYQWKNSTSKDDLKLQCEKTKDKLKGTEIILKKLPEDLPIFQWSFNQLKYILRTRTSVGNTNKIWGEDIDIKIHLEYINQDGEGKKDVLPFKYFLPIEGLDSKNTIDIDDFWKYTKEKDRTDAEKRVKLKDKIIFKKTTHEHHGREIKSFVCYMPKRKTWKDLTIHNELATEEQWENDQWKASLNYAILQPGIFTSVKGMPSGVMISHPSTYAAGAWPQIFMIFEDRRLKFDIGRKSIHGKQGEIYRNYAKKIFDEFQKLAKYISGEVVNTPDWEKEDIFAEIDKLIDLNIPGVHLIKTPREQEASVAGLFFECIGNGKINEIEPIISGYRNKYDLYAKWGNKKVVIEFKSKISNVISDFSDQTKLFNELDCLVCWDVTEEDIQNFADIGVDLSEIETNTLPGSSSIQFPNSTHILSLSGFTKPVYILDMKKVISK